MHPDIEKFQVAVEYAYLKKKVITLAGKPPHLPARTILIMEGCSLIAFRQGNIKAELLLREFEKGMAQTFDKVYAPLAAMSFGDVPTPEEFLALPSEDTNAWVAAGKEMNPDYFRWLDAAEQLVIKLTEQDIKKNVKKPRRSASG